MYKYLSGENQKSFGMVVNSIRIPYYFGNKYHFFYDEPTSKWYSSISRPENINQFPLVFCLSAAIVKNLPVNWFLEMKCDPEQLLEYLNDHNIKEAP